MLYKAEWTPRSIWKHPSRTETGVKLGQGLFTAPLPLNLGLKKSNGRRAERDTHGTNQFLLIIIMPEEELEVLSELAVDGEDDEATRKKRETNRKKREKAKAKKKATAAEEADQQGRWQRGKLPGNRADRRDAGAGRGLGVFALEPIKAGEVVAEAPPALSVVFDNAVEDVCSFCFQRPDKGAVEELQVTLETAMVMSADGTTNRSFGLKLDDHVPTAGAEPCTIVTAVTKDSPNRGSVRLGDRVLAVDGEPVTGGHAAAVPMLLAAAQKHEGAVPCTIGRPALLTCPGCKKVSCCAHCVGEGRLTWHACECKLYNAMPAGATTKGDTSTLRLLLRYKVSSEPAIGEWTTDKEPLSLLRSLQANACEVPPEQLAGLSRLAGLRSDDVAALIYQIRTNACQIARGTPPSKAGCALSVLTGWHNHACAPNAEATVGDDGKVCVRALADVAEGEEVTISYIDASLPHDERAKILIGHYGFECKCTKCAVEGRKALSKRMKERDNYLASQRR